MGKVFFRNRINEGIVGLNDRSLDKETKQLRKQVVSEFLDMFEGTKQYIDRFQQLINSNKISYDDIESVYDTFEKFNSDIYKIIFEERLFNERHGIHEGFSFYDEKQWLPEKNFFDNNFRVFCRKHDIIIENKQLYDLCELLYDGILKYSFDALQELKGKDIEGYFSQAFYDVRNFLYNRDATSEHYTEFPSGDDLYKLRNALRIIGSRSFGPYNFVHPSRRATEMLNELQVK